MAAALFTDRSINTRLGDDLILIDAIFVGNDNTTIDVLERS